MVNSTINNGSRDVPKVWGKRRSIVRRIGSYLPLQPAPKIFVSVTPLHSMSGSMIIEDANNHSNSINGFSDNRLSASKPDLLEPITFGSEVRLLALEQELHELRSQVSKIVQIANHQERYSSTTSLPGANVNTCQMPPPPPPPLPPPPSLPLPSTPHIARRASLNDHKIEDKKKLIPQLSTHDLLKDIDKVKLKPVERSPGGRPLKLKPRRDNSPCNDLQEILRKRYLAMRSPESRNSSILDSSNSKFDESF